MKLWETRSGKLLRTLERHQKSVSSVVFDPHDARQRELGQHGELWEVQSGKLLRTLEWHTNEVDRVAFSSDGRLLASKSRDHTSRLWSC